MFPEFRGNRKWAGGYDILTLGDGEDDDEPVNVYGRPVYLSTVEGGNVNDDAGTAVPDVIFFNGLRWAMASVSDIGSSTGTPRAANSTNIVAGQVRARGKMIADFFSNEFHAYWSRYTVGFLSDRIGYDAPEDTNTPTGLNWFEAQVRGDETSRTVQGPDLNKPVESKFLCTSCSNETNPCQLGGVCADDGDNDGDGTCLCSTGSTGQLCQIAPTGNGQCDPYFNTLEFDYDGGDCCRETCVSTLEHTCGEGIIGQSFGVDAYGYVGFPHCILPLNSLAGSTLDRIQQRGYLICGTLRSTIKELAVFYSNQVRALVKMNSPAIEIYWTYND